jgi:hypothetical protein
MPCDHWYRLLERYRGAAKAYCKSVDRLESPDFDPAWHSAEAALKDCRVARAVLMDHEHDHGCVTGEWEAGELVLGDQGQSGG